MPALGQFECGMVGAEALSIIYQLPCHALFQTYHHEVTSVEIDPSVKYIAVGWFHYPHEERIVVEDGLKYMATLAANGKDRFDLIVIDVCSSSDLDEKRRGEVICPGEVFLQTEVINYARNLSRLPDSLQRLLLYYY